MGGKLWIIIIGFQLKLSLGLLLTAHRSTSSSSHFFPCSASPPLLHRNFRYIFYVAIFSNLSHFFPSLGSWLVLASSSLSVCSCSYQHSSLRLSLSPQFPFPLGGVPTIHLHTVGMVWGPGIQQTAEITTQVICENQVQDHLSRKEVIFIAVRYRAWIQPEERYFSDHQQTHHSDALISGI